MSGRLRIPVATYRLQLHQGFHGTVRAGSGESRLSLSAVFGVFPVALLTPSS